MATTYLINGEAYPTAGEALQARDAEGWEVVIQIGGKTVATTQAEADRLDAAGASFAYLTDLRGQIVTVPVN